MATTTTQMLFLTITGVLILLCQNNINVAAQNCGVSRRRPWRSLSCEEQQDYLNAVQEMKDSGIYDEITRVHRNSGDDNHFLPTFLPFHRWHIWVFERELQRFGGCGMTVPYWDWENGSRSRVNEWVLQEYSFGTPPRGCVRNGIAANWRAENNDGCLIREFVQSEDYSNDVEVLNRITNAPTFSEFSPSLEGAPHTSVHDYIGGPMEGFWAPDDPLFHLHHANVDRIYSLWQDYYNHDRLDPDQFGSRHYNDNLDRPLRIQQERRVDFDSPNTRRAPTPRELMLIRGNDAIMQVQYVDDNLARTLRQTDRDYDNNILWHSPGNAPTRGCRGGGGGGGGGGGSGGNQVRFVGNNGSPSSAYPLGRCEGDCDDDSECRGSLICFQRRGNEAVPGCAGGESYANADDFCISRNNNDDGDDHGDNGPPRPSRSQVRFVGNNGSPSSAYPLGRCEGDCDDDRQCEGNLVCYQRGGNEAVPGCTGGESYTNADDFCVSPRDVIAGGGNNNNRQPGRVQGRVQNDGSLRECEGHCDSSSECRGDLFCFRRNWNEPVPGCAPHQTNTPGTDYCVSPRSAFGQRFNNLRRVLQLNETETEIETEIETETETEVTNKSNAQDNESVVVSLSSEKLQTRWNELMNLYPNDAAHIFEILSREDCEERAIMAATLNHTKLRSIRPEWMGRRNMTEQEVHMMDCHYLAVYIAPIIEEKNQTMNNTGDE